MSRNTFEFHAAINQIDLADQWIGGQLEDWSALPRVEFFQLACHELVINSVEAMMQVQGNPLIQDRPGMMLSESSQLIRLSFETDEQAIVFTSNDWGGGIPEEFLEGCGDEDPFRERGRGIQMICMMTDGFEMISEEDGSYSYRIHMNI